MIYKNEGNSENISILLNKLRREGTDLEYRDTKELLERTYHLLKNDSSDYINYNLGLSVICHLANIKIEESFLNELLKDCIVQSRIFLYRDMISSNKLINQNLNFSYYDEIAKAFYTLEETNTILTRDQKHLYDLFISKRRVVVSAPTSFGKSRIVQEIIIHNDYKNMLIVLPTIALLNETFVKFKTNTVISSKYQLYNSLGPRDSKFRKENNIFILTPEKTDLLLDQNPEIKFDFFTMDEIYKIQDGDERSKIFTNCLYRMSKIPNIHFYLIGPYFSSFSKNFLEKTNSNFVIFESEIVQKDEIDLSKLNRGEQYEVNGKALKILADNRKNLRNIFKAVDGQSLVYRGAQRNYAELLAKYLIDFKKRDCSLELIEYIKENISPDWTLVKCLESGIAFHHGALPKYIQTEIIDAFNSNDLDLIVCTSTIVEGVNTTAKNVIIFDQFKGQNELDGFDVKNIKGRAGRFLSHFIGNIYSMVPLSQDQNKGEIEFSFYDSLILDSEDTIQVEKTDLKGENLTIRENVESILKRENIPLEVIKSNKFIKVHKQIGLINVIRTNFFLLEELHFTGNLPTKEQLEKMLYLCHEHLFSERHLNDRNYTIGQLIRFTKYYVYLKPTIKQLIDEHTHTEYIDTKVRNTFNLISNYFEFAIPKYLTAFENLYNFVYSERGLTGKGINLTFLITVLEFGHSEEHEIALKEAGLPNEIIKKVSDKFKDCSNLEQVRNKYAMNPYLINSLSNFERKIFNRYI